MNLKFTLEHFETMETIMKLRGFEDFTAEHLKTEYEQKAEFLKIKFGITEDDLNEFKILKLAAYEREKAELNAKAFFLNGVKFKNKEHFIEYLKSHGLLFTFKFCFLGLLNKSVEVVKLKFKKSSLKSVFVFLLLFSAFKTYIGVELTTFKNYLIITFLNDISWGLSRVVRNKILQKLKK